MYKTADNKNILTLLNKPGQCSFWEIKNYQVAERICVSVNIELVSGVMRLYSNMNSFDPTEMYSTKKAANRALVKMLRTQIREALTNN